MERRNLALIIGLIAVLVGTAVAQAATNKKRIRSHVTMSEAFDPDTAETVLFGDVSSRRSKCERGRTLTLRKEDVGLVGEGVTEFDGHWEIRISGGASGKYKVQADAKRRPRFVCRPARAAVTLD